MFITSILEGFWNQMDVLHWKRIPKFVGMIMIPIFTANFWPHLVTDDVYGGGT